MCCWSKTQPFEQRIGTSDFLPLNLLTQQRRGRIFGSRYFAPSSNLVIFLPSLGVHRSRIWNGARKGTFSIGTFFTCIFKSVTNQQNRAWHSFIGQTDLCLECAHCQSLLHELKDCNSLGLFFCWRFVGGRQVMHFLPQEGEKRWLRLVPPLFTFIHYSGEGDAIRCNVKVSWNGVIFAKVVNMLDECLFGFRNSLARLPLL